MSDTLIHYGIPGQKWGVRRYQNEDGSLTPAGKKRYSIGNLFNVQNRTKTTTYTKRGNIERESSSGGGSFNPLNIQNHSKRTTYTHWGDVTTESGTPGRSFNPLNVQKGSTTVSRLTDENPSKELIEALNGGSNIGNALAEAKENVKLILEALKKGAIKVRWEVDKAAKKAVEKGKEVVNKVLDIAKNAAVKVKDVASAFGSKLAKALNVQDYSKKTTYTHWGDATRESGTPPKSSNPLNVQNGTKKTTRLTDDSVDKNFLKTLSKKWPYK